jgi:septum formation protein
MIILASASLRRQELLKSINIDFKVFHPEVEEKLFNDPYLTVKTNSLMKFQKSKRFYPNDYIISADTIVYSKGKVLPKPKDRAQALYFLKRLSNSTHEVITAITIGYEPETFVFSTKVTFYDLGKTTLNLYLNTNEWIDKAGGYAIQGFGKILVKEVNGDYFNVVGLPVSFVWKKLLKDGVIK